MVDIMEACAGFFERDEWPCERVEEGPLAMLRSRYQGSNGTFDCWFQVRRREEQFMFYCRAPVNVPEGRRQSVAEFMARANYGMVLGNFELDMDDGEMRFKCSADVEGLEINDIFLKNVVYTSVVTMNRYLPGLMKVAFSSMDPVDAVNEIEKPAESEN